MADRYRKDFWSTDILRNLARFPRRWIFFRLFRSLELRLQKNGKLFVRRCCLRHRRVSGVSQPVRERSLREPRRRVPLRMQHWLPGRRDGRQLYGHRRVPQPGQLSLWHVHQPAWRLRLQVPAQLRTESRRHRMHWSVSLCRLTLVSVFIRS